MFCRWREHRRKHRERLDLLRQRRDRAGAGSPSRGSLHDPIEDDPQFQPMLAEAKTAANEILGEKAHTCPPQLIWKIMQELLAERGVIWFTPQEMNPDSNFV